MFFNYIFTKTNENEILFHAIETISVVLTRYTRQKGLPKSKYKKVAEQMIDEIIKASKPTYEENILDVADDLCANMSNPSFNIGFSIFTVNLFIKKIAMLMKPKDRLLLNAPFNRDELNVIKGSPTKKISGVNRENYADLIKNAKKYIATITSPRKYSCIYDWELWYWNNK